MCTNEENSLLLRVLIHISVHYGFQNGPFILMETEKRMGALKADTMCGLLYKKADTATERRKHSVTIKGLAFNDEMHTGIPGTMPTMLEFLTKITLIN